MFDQRQVVALTPNKSTRRRSVEAVALAERHEPSEYRTRLAIEAAVAIDTLEAFDAFLRIFPPGAYADRIIAVRDAYLGRAGGAPIIRLPLHRGSGP